MTDLITAGVLGVVEGLTEFLPVSSTGHLILVGETLKFTQGNAATFDIAIQLGAILAVVAAFPGYFISLLNPKSWLSPKGKALILACLPVMAVGFLTHHWIKTHLFNPLTVALALIVGAIAMIVVQKRPQPSVTTHDIEAITPKQALWIGISQCFSLWPGMSRSASTIMGGLLAGLSYELAAQFSFLIAVPVMVAAVTFDLIKSASVITSYDLQLIGVGFGVAFGVAWASIYAMLMILKKYKLVPFAIYRIVLGAILFYALLR